MCLSCVNSHVKCDYAGRPGKGYTRKLTVYSVRARLTCIDAVKVDRTGGDAKGPGGGPARKRKSRPLLVSSDEGAASAMDTGEDSRAVKRNKKAVSEGVDGTWVAELSRLRIAGMEASARAAAIQTEIARHLEVGPEKWKGKKRAEE
jgi:hypothetical protein